MELTDSGERGARRPRSGVSERDARDMQAGRAAQDASRGRRRKARLRPVQWLGFLRTPLAREGEKVLDCTRLGVTALLLPQSGQPAARCPLGL